MDWKLDIAIIDITISFLNEYSNSPQFRIYTENRYMWALSLAIVSISISKAIGDGTETRSTGIPNYPALKAVNPMFPMVVHPRSIAFVAYPTVVYARSISLLAYPTLVYANSDMSLAYPMVVYTRSTSLLAYPTAVYVH